MRKLIFLLFSLSIFIQISCQKNVPVIDIPNQEPSEYNLNVMTFNIRYGSKDGINDWKYRKKMATDVFKNYDIDIAGLQEVTDFQTPDLKKTLTNYEFFGANNGTGSYNPIIYKKNKFKLLDSGDFWLSNNPEVVGSIGWDAKFPRNVTWGKFKCNENGKEFYFFNTHFDHVGTIAKRESSKLLMSKLPNIAGNVPTILTGDFNFTKDDSYYNLIVDTSNKLNVKDTKNDSKVPYTGVESSFNGFGKPQMVIIDFIFVTKNITTEKYDILRIREGDVYISDHYPVFSILSL